MNERVDHPEHYQADGFECIRVMTAVYGKEATAEFCIQNAFKYIWRYGKKDDGNDDVRKAVWYLNKYLELMEG